MARALRDRRRIFALCLALCTTPAAAQISHQLNLPQTLAPIKAALANGEQVDIVAIGDSLTMRPDSWLPVFRAALKAQYGDAGAGYLGFMDRNGVLYAAPWGGGVVDADPSPHRSLDGIWSVSPQNPIPIATAQFVAPDPQLELHYAKLPGGGIFEVRRVSDAALLATLNTNSMKPELGVWSYFSAQKNAVLSVTPLGPSPVTMLGYNSTVVQPGVRVHRVANGGWGVNNFLLRDWTFDLQIQAVDPELVYIWLGQNDQYLGAAVYNQKLAELVDRIQAAVPGVSIILISTYDSGSYLLEPFAAEVRAVAESRGLGFIDLFHAAGTTEFFVESAYRIDTVHFNQAGGNYIGSIMRDAFLTDGASLTTAITTHPKSYFAQICKPGYFSVQIDDAISSASFQWRKDGVELIESNVFRGVNTDSLAVHAETFEDTGRFDVIVTTAVGVEVSRFGVLRLIGIQGCVGDADGNDRVNFDDLPVVLAHWGTQYFPSICAPGSGDANFDLRVDFDDLSSVLRHWGRRCE